MYRKIISFVAFILLAFTCSLFAQENEKARNYENKAYEYFVDSSYAKASAYYLKAIQEEMKSQSPDPEIIARDYEFAASMQEELNNYTKSLDYYLAARKYFKASGNWENIKSNLYTLASFFDRIYSKNAKIDFGPNGLEKSYAYFLVDSILCTSGDTSWVRINGGNNDHIIQGGKGDVISVYNPDEKNRGNIILGSVYHESSGNNSGICYVIHNNTNDQDIRVRIGDMVALPNMLPKKDQFMILSELANIRILFQNKEKSSIFTCRELLFINDTSFQNDIIRLMAEDVQETVVYLQGYLDDNPDWNAPLEGGKYDGVGMFDAMELTSPDDISAFLAFVDSYPGKYMGNTWKINETYATWLINATPLADFDKTLFNNLLYAGEKKLKEFVTQNAYYITDTIFHRFNAMFNDLYLEEKFDSAGLLVDRFIWIADLLNNNHYKSMFLVGKSNLSQNQENWQESIKILNEAIESDSTNLNTYFFRGYAYGKLKDYHKAVQDYKMIVKYNPALSVGYGNQGWYYLLDGKIFDALEACKKAYELDSFQVSNTVNLGHAYMLLGDTTTACKYYDKTLELITSITEFMTGPVADFDIFIENEWQTSLSEYSKQYMLDKYNKIYKYRIISDSIENVARGNDTEKNYPLALDNMLKSYEYELQSKAPRPEQLYVVTSWIGYLYQQVKAFENAENYYNKCLHYAHDVLRSDAKTANVYDLFSWLYDVWGKKADYLAVTEKKEKYQQLADEAGKERKLYLLAVGNNEYYDVSYQYAHHDAEKMVSALTENAANYYDSVSAQIIRSEELTLDKLEKAFRQVIIDSRPDDVFMFYFGGTASLDTNIFKLTIPRNDTVEKTVSIDVNTIKTWLSSIQARNQFLMLDAFAPSFIDEFVGNYAISRGALSGSNLNLGILSLASHRIENDSLQHGTLSHAVIDIMQHGDELPFADDKDLSIKDLNAHLFTQKNKNGELLSWNTYYTGDDFVLISYDSVNVDSRQQQAIPERSRGVGILNDDFTGNGDFSGKSTHYALLFATNDYYEWNDLANPIFDANALAKTLEEDYGYRVELLTNNTRMDVLTKIREYQKKQYNPNDQLFIFFAGHGSFDDISGEGYIVCKDSRKDDEIRASYIPYSYLRENVNNIRSCKHILIALDVCFGGTFDKQVSKFGRSADAYTNISKDAFIRRAMQFKSRLFITSGSKEYVSDGDPGKHSPFAYNILDVLRSQSMINGYATFNMLVQAVERLQTTPRYGDFGDNEPGSEFIFNVQVKQPQRAFKVDNLKK